MEQRSDMRCELQRCQKSIEQLGDAINLLDAILNDEARLNELDREA